MTPSDDQRLEAYLPVYDTVPETWDDAQAFLAEQLKRIANAINVREIGWYLDEELLSGKAFTPGINAGIVSDTSQNYRQIFRKVINFGTLPNAATKSVPHGITFDNNFTLIQIWASATDPVAFKAIPIPYVDPNVFANGIKLDMDATNVNITTAANYTAYTRCFVVIEYLQEL